jgi:hypothetical protein
LAGSGAATYLEVDALGEAAVAVLADLAWCYYKRTDTSLLRATHVGAFARVGAEVRLEVVPLGKHLGAPLDLAEESLPLRLAAGGLVEARAKLDTD